MLELAKILVAFVGGGLAGALTTEWFRRRREKVQRVQLIERVNRLINPIEGFTLVRTVAGGDGILKEVTDLREYQLTMRNSTSTHLKNAEVQFEFPSDDVQALVSLPALSRIELSPIDTPKTAGTRVFRWMVPHFPAGDSVEFTFRAVAPSSDKYGYSLNYIGVILERVVGEPPPRDMLVANLQSSIQIVAIIGTLIFTAYSVKSAFTSKPATNEPIKHVSLTNISKAGCELQVASSADPYLYGSDIWEITNRIINSGNQECVIQSHALNLDVGAHIEPGITLDKHRLSERVPKVTEATVSIGPVGVKSESATVRIYAEP
jgi:hypothetical protein